MLLFLLALSCGLALVVGCQWHRRNLQLRLANDNLSRQRQVLRQKLRTSLTAAAVAHEINQPISSLSLLSEQLIRLAQEQPGPEGSLPLLQLLLSESRRVAEITEKMRMLLSSVETEHGPVALQAVVQGAITYLKRRMAAEAVQLEVIDLEAGDALIHGDAAQLQVAITNLLRNALAAVASQPADRRSIQLSLRRGAGLPLELVVADSGPGFPEDLLGLDLQEERLFTTTAAGGMGLGLYVVAATMENHGGQMLLGCSASLGGAEVRLQFPPYWS
ncbi:MAG: sensor histidine kinase [Cyanobacteriota bacterium]